MQSRIFILFILFFVSVSKPLFVSASDPSFMSNSEPQYVKPTSVRDTLIGSDSIVVIHTVCAPICSSHVRVYNKEWEYIGTIKPNFKSAFPEAYIQDEKLYWRDNDTTDYSPVP